MGPARPGDLNPADTGRVGRRLNFIYNKDLHGKQNKNFLNRNILMLLNKTSLTQPLVRPAAPGPLLATPA